MLSVLWTVMVIVSMAGGLALHTSGAVAAAAMEGAAAAVELCLSLAGPLCLWCGVGELMGKSGLRGMLARGLAPLLGRLFPSLRQDPKGFSALCANFTANLLGLGNAATPMGIEACRAMADGTGRAPGEMCRLVVMNTASIQLLPATVAAVRTGLGCRTPLDILPCVLATSLCAVTAGLVMCLALERLSGGR